jgi:hypothetical protein
VREGRWTAALTISLGDSGALSASAISCAFWLTLPLRVLIVLKASLKLFCRPCRVDGPDMEPFEYPYLPSLRDCHLSVCIGFPFEGAVWLGLAPREELRPNGSSSCVGSNSDWKAGNLKVECGLESRAAGDMVAGADKLWERVTLQSVIRPWGAARLRARFKAHSRGRMRYSGTERMARKSTMESGGVESVGNQGLRWRIFLVGDIDTRPDRYGRLGRRTCCSSFGRGPCTVPLLSNLGRYLTTSRAAAQDTVPLYPHSGTGASLT